LLQAIVVLSLGIETKQVPLEMLEGELAGSQLMEAPVVADSR
jgi:hypothetical protein